VESLCPGDVRKTLGARLTRETRTGTKLDSERHKLPDADESRERRRKMSKREGVTYEGDTERNTSKQTVRGASLTLSYVSTMQSRC